MPAMMRFWGWILSVFMMASATQVAAQQGENPVVVELFSSQGCSSCPPADRMLARLAQRDDVIALALHVDYWDYIGWKDSFAQPAFTARQKGYAYAAGQRSVYTPQIVVNGLDHVMGANSMDVMDRIRAHQDQRSPVAVRLSRASGSLLVEADAAKPVGSMEVFLVRYRPSASVRVARGENAGRTLDYANVVTEWSLLGRWPGDGPLRMSVVLRGDNPAVVLIQKPDHGPIVAAASLR